MNARYLIDSVVHSLFYSLVPSLVLEQNQRFFFVRYIDSPDRLLWRCPVQIAIAFLYFWVFQSSGARNRYIMWHMERNTAYSGFHPLEVLGVSLYFSVFLHIPTELALLWFPNTNPFLTSDVWFRQFVSRINLLFLIGCSYHIFLEKIGCGNISRARYFRLEFLL